MPVHLSTVYLPIPDKTLEENGIADESEEFEELGLPDDYYISAIHIYFNDDLTIG